ncbi:MAG: LysM peptidoglycan-binding domain-containing protein [Candidatus Tyrphobacter sp.]
MRTRKRVSLVPAIALAALSLSVTLPALSSVRLYAATPQRSTFVTVRSGDTLWSIAAAHTAADGNIESTIDRINAVNHLGTAPLQPGERLRIPL